MIFKGLMQHEKDSAEKLVFFHIDFGYRNSVYQQVFLFIDLCGI